MFWKNLLIRLVLLILPPERIDKLADAEGRVNHIQAKRIVHNMVVDEPNLSIFPVGSDMSQHKLNVFLAYRKPKN
ncbi:MAG: hypothetical protein EBW14_11780 [Oxalobacteraceae bacterium]|nr:hypothetical protein [Oxalobacteraceae bacterium]